MPNPYRTTGDSDQRTTPSEAPPPYELPLAPGIRLVNDAFLRRANLERLPVGVLLWRPDGSPLLANEAARDWLRLPESFVPSWQRFWSTARMTRGSPDEGEGELEIALSSDEVIGLFYRLDRVFNLSGEHVAEAVYLTPLATTSSAGGAAPPEPASIGAETFPAQSKPTEHLETGSYATESLDSGAAGASAAGSPQVLGILVCREGVLVASGGYDARWPDVSRFEGESLDAVARYLQRETEYGYFPRHRLEQAEGRGAWTFALVVEDRPQDVLPWDARNLMAATAHEMRNPLATVRGFLQLLPQANAEDRERYITIALREIDRVAEIVNEFLEQHAEVALGRQPLIDLRVPVHEAVLSLATLARERGVDLEEVFGEGALDAGPAREALPPSEAGDGEAPAQATVVAEGPSQAQGSTGTTLPIWVRAQPNRMFQLTRNLVENAIHAVRSPGGRVWVTVGLETPRWALLAVDDDGPGIPEPIRERIFEPSFTQTPGGHGFGLTIARWIVTSHRGDLRVARSKHGGARFEVRLPVAAEAGPRGEAPNGTNPAAQAPESTTVGEGEDSFTARV